MAIVYRGAGPWGGGKGSNLTAAEVDDNFFELAQAILGDTDEVPPVGIANITVIGSQMTITLDNANVLGPYTLPVAVLRYRGDFAGLTAYAAFDIFHVPGKGLWLTLRGHTSATDFDPTESDTEGDVYQQVLPQPTAGGYSTVRNFAGTDIDFSSELTLDRAGGFWRCSNGSSTTIWLPDDADMNYEVGTKLSFELTDPYGELTFTASLAIERLEGKASTAHTLFALVEAVKVDTAPAKWFIRGDLD